MENDEENRVHAFNQVFVDTYSFQYWMVAFLGKIKIKIYPFLYHL